MLLPLLRAVSKAVRVLLPFVLLFLHIVVYLFFGTFGNSFLSFFSFFKKSLRKVKLEKPLLYSNIPLFKQKYVLLTTDILLRKERMAYGSVVIMDEASLVADSQLIKDKNLNTQLLLFFKLFGHETKGGKLIVNTHCLSDLHYSLKRCTSSYYYVQHLTKLPFVSRFSVREERYSDDGTVVNSYDKDVDKSMLSLFCLNGFYKKYDAFCYSVLTDNLSVRASLLYTADRGMLKSPNIVSFRPEFRNVNTNGGNNP